MQTLQFVLLGLGLGGAYALLALGVVAIYRGTGVPNFAQGGIAMISAYVFFGLRDEAAMAWPVAMVLTLLFAAVLGIAFHFLVMRQLRDSPVLARIVATLALVLLLQGLALLLFEIQSRTPSSILPSRVVSVMGVNLTTDRIYVAAIAIVISVALVVVSRRSRLGLAVQAIAENEKAAVLLGYSPGVLSAVTWATGSLLAALAGILISPIAGLDANALTLLVVPVFGAALVARFHSFPIAVVAGFGIGMAQSVLQSYTQPGSWWTVLWAGPGRVDAVPALVIIVAMVLSGRLLPTRGQVSLSRLPMSPEPRHVIAGPAVALVLGLVFILTVSRSWVSALTTSLIGALIALSLIVVTGYIGQISLMQYAFAGVGALLTAQLTTLVGLPFPLPMIVAALAGGAVGALVGIPAVRVRGPSLAIVTLSAAVVFEQLIFQDRRVLRAGGFLRLERPELFGASLDHTGFAVFALLVTIGLAVAVMALRRGRLGRTLLAVRENERAASAAGIDVVRAKLAAFALAALIAATAGALMAYQQRVFSPDRFAVLESLFIIVIAYIGGIGMVSGAIFAGLGVAGGLFFKLLTEWGIGEYHQVIAGGALLVALQLHPDGLASVVPHLRLRGKRRRAATPTANAAARHAPAAGHVATIAAERPDGNGSTSFKRETDNV